MHEKYYTRIGNLVRKHGDSQDYIAWSRICAKRLNTAHSTARNKRKGESVPHCISCGRAPRKGDACSYVYNGDACRKWWAAHLSPVA
jgi:hypothetical protein